MIKNKKNVLVTGGCGFIGSHLVEKLIKLHFKVIVIDNLSTGRIENINKFINKIVFIKGDIRLPKTFKKIDKIKIDYVFHLAALADIVPSINNPNKYFKSNVVGTEYLLNYFKNKDIKKLVYAASSSCYGIPKQYPTKEKSIMDPKYPYALSKMIGEQLIDHYGKIYNIPYISLRLFNVYGTRSRTSGTYGAVFGVFLAQLLAGKPLTVVGDGKQSRDFTYVSDVVDAMTKSAFSKKKNLILNVGSGKSISINQIVNLLNSEHVNIPKRPGEPDKTFADISKIKSELNWSPKIDISKGIKILLSNIEYWKRAPVWSPKKINNATKLWFKYLK